METKRKNREWVNFILTLIAGLIIFSVCELMPPISYIFYPIGMFCCYEGVRYIVTYDITTWKNAKFWIWIGGIFGILGSFIIYLYFRHKNIKPGVGNYS